MDQEPASDQARGLLPPALPKPIQPMMTYPLLGDVVMHAVEAYMSSMNLNRVDADSGGKLMRKYVQMYLDGPDAE